MDKNRIKFLRNRYYFKIKLSVQVDQDASGKRIELVTYISVMTKMNRIQMGKICCQLQKTGKFLSGFSP